MKPPSKRITILLILVLLIISRLPYLIGGSFMLDGDESIMGLMAKHLFEGKELPVFFYGQSYGFAFLEVLSIAGMYSLFDVSAIAVKIAMLLLFAIGIVFFYLTLYEINKKSNSWLIIIITLLFVTAPSWAIWATKARGGYLTSFLFCFFFTYLLSNSRANKNPITISVLGLVFLIIQQAQPLWLVGLIPFIVYFFWKSSNKKRWLLFPVGLIVGYFAFSFLKHGLASFWSPSIIKWERLQEFEISSFIEQLIVSISGSYNYIDRIEYSFSAEFTAIVYLIGMLLLLSWSVFSFFHKRISTDWLSVALLFSVILTIGYTVILPDQVFRYLLPLQGYLLLLIFSVLRRVNYKYVTISTLTILLGFSSVALYSLHHNPISDRSAIKEVVDIAEDKGVRYVFCEEGLLQWKLMFYSNESIVARYRYNTDRYQPYVDSVNQALANSQPNIGIIGYLPHKMDSLESQITTVQGKFFLLENPSKELLKKRKFQID